MDAELKQYLMAMEARIISHVDEKFERVNERFERVNEKFEQVISYVNERSEQIETRLLTEFHKWASPAEARSRTISAALRAIDLELEAIDHIKKLENRPPQ